jgi:hypothetical protein
MSKRVDKAILLITFLLPLLMAITVGWLLYPYPITDIQMYEVYEAVDGNRETRSYQIRAGDDLEFEINFTKHFDAPAEVSVLLKQVRNGYLYPYDRITTTRMPLGKRHFKSAITIPRTTPPGTYILIRSYRYLVNPLNNPTVVAKSNEFEVRGKTPNPVAIIEDNAAIAKQVQKRLDRIEREMIKK